MQAVVFLVSCMVWHFEDESILGKVAMVSAIIAATLYHRIAGIMALTVFIALMKNRSRRYPNNVVVVEGLTPAPIHFASSAEFREKYCMKGIAQSDGTGTGTGTGTTPAMMDYQYMLSPALVDDSNGKPQLKPEVMKQIDIDSFDSCKKNPTSSIAAIASIANMCDPKCNWKMNTKEGFTPMVANSTVQNVKNYVKDSANNVKDKLKESFSRYRS
jgi:hypothetical protein